CSSPKITRIYKGLENIGGTPGLAAPVESIEEIPHVSPYPVRLPGLASAAHAIVSSIRRKKLSCAGHCRSLRQCRRPFRHESGPGQNARAGHPNAKQSRAYDQQYNSALPSIRPGNSDVATAHRSDGATNRPHGTLKRAPPSRIGRVVSRARTAGGLTCSAERSPGNVEERPFRAGYRKHQRGGFSPRGLLFNSAKKQKAQSRREFSRVSVPR